MTTKKRKPTSVRTALRIVRKVLRGMPVPGGLDSVLHVKPKRNKPRHRHRYNIRRREWVMPTMFKRGEEGYVETHRCKCGKVKP